MKIISVKDRQLSSTEFFEFLKQLVAIIIKYDTAKLKVASAANALIAIFTSLEVALNKEKASQLTKILNELDHKRDVLISAFIAYLHAMTDFPDATVAAHAADLLQYIDGFSKNIARENQLSETTILSTITEGILNNPTRKAALIAVNGMPWVTAIATVNNDYATQYRNRISDDSSNEKIETFTVVRKKALTAYNQLISLLQSRYTTDKADALDISLYETAIGDMNTLITKVNILAATSKPHEKGGEDGKK
jgi:hypothetical protein